MNKQIPKYFFVLILVLILVGCKISTLSTKPTQIELTLKNTIVSPTSLLVPTPIQSVTMIPIVTVVQHPSLTTSPTITALNTLEPEKANEQIKTLLQEPVDCSAPCFWGIEPGQSTTGEVIFTFNHLGIQTETIMYQGQDFINVDYDLDNGLSISVNLSINNNVVETIVITLVPNLQKEGIIREWSAYSPDVLIKRYGQPSRVDFMADWGPMPFFTMQLYFDAHQLIVQYAGPNIIPNEKGPALICPLTTQFESVRLWMGNDPHYPPAKGVELSEVVSMNLDEFVELMTQDQSNACFNINGDVFH